MADLSLKKAVPYAVVANCDDHQIVTTPVGLYKPNPWGLYDILGNVAEWVEDCYVKDYNNTPGDGNVVTTQDCNTRAVRGGSWSFPPRYLRAAYRIGLMPDYRNNYVGFRVARIVAP